MTEMSRDEMLKMLNEQQAMIAKLVAERNAPRKLSMKVTEKGGASLYGLGRFPVTLYKSQWQTLLKHTAMIEAFLADNDKLLATKD